jgi:hypothetical protein
MDVFDVNKIREKPCNIITIGDRETHISCHINILYHLRYIPKVFILFDNYDNEMVRKLYDYRISNIEYIYCTVNKRDKDIEDLLNIILKIEDKKIVIFNCHSLDKNLRTTNNIYHKLLKCKNTYCIISLQQIEFKIDFEVAKEIDYLFKMQGRIIINEYNKYFYTYLIKTMRNLEKINYNLKKISEKYEYNWYKYSIRIGLAIDIKNNCDLSLFNVYCDTNFKIIIGQPLVKLTNEEKNEIHKKAHHPKRVKYYLELGYEVDDIFC